MLPIKDLNPTTRTAWVTIGLIAANVVIFLLWQPTFSNSDIKQELFFFCHAEIPWETTHQTSLAQGGSEAVAAINNDQIGIPGQALQQALQEGVHGRTSSGQRVDVPGCPHKSWWQSIFVAMFLHGGWLHIGGNMLFLWIFGNNVEDKLGPILYLLFHIGAGIAASVGQLLIDTNSIVPNLGASGAIAGVLGAYIVMFPRRRVLTVVFFFFITAIWLPAWAVLGAWFILQLFNGVGAVTAHINAG